MNKSESQTVKSSTHHSNNNHSDNQANIRHVTDLLLLQQQLRSMPSLTELGYFLVNDTQKIFSYQTAILCFDFTGSIKIEAISSLPKASEHSPFSSWFTAFYSELKACYQSETSIVKRTDLSSDICKQWEDFLPEQIVYIPLSREANDAHTYESLGALILARNEVWKDEELGVLKYWRGAISYTIDFIRLKKRSIFSRLKSKKSVVWTLILLALVFIMFIPVSLTVMAPIEIVAKDPILIRAPIDGVIGEIYVRPNQYVKKNQLLLTLDEASLSARLSVAEQELAIAQAEYRRTQQASVIDRQASSNLPMLKARIEQRLAETTYAKSLLERIVLRAQQNGIVIIPDIHELEGKPVSLGEKILTLADPTSAEGEVWLAVADSIELPNKTAVEVFLNVHPDRPYKAFLNYENYQAELSPEGILAFRTRIDLASKNIPRIGLRGMAKLYGEKVSLFYYLFRRPFAVVRQWIGL